MLKKIVSLVVGATLVLATLGVAAADVATVSEYNQDGSITVTTTVSNADAGEVYTYLAYKLASEKSVEDLTDGEVVYVDEKEIADDKNGTTFVYTTSAEKLGATVVVGLDAAGTDEGEIEVVDPIEYRKYSVKVGDGLAEEQEVAVTDSTGAPIDPSTLITITANGIANAVIDAVTVNGVAVDTWFATNDGIKLPLSAIEENSVVAITLGENAIETTVTLWNRAYIAESDAVIAVAQIEGAPGTYYGIEFGADVEFATSFKADAKGMGTNGMYAVRLNSINDDASQLKGAEKVYVKAYASGVESDVLEIEIPAAE